MTRSPRSLPSEAASCCARSASTRPARCEPAATLAAAARRQLPGIQRQTRIDRGERDDQRDDDLLCHLILL